MAKWNGWQRLWLVCALLLGAPAAFLAYDIHSHIKFYTYMNLDEMRLAKADRDRVFWRRAQETGKLSHCARNDGIDVGPGYGDGWYVSCDTSSDYTLSRTLFYGALPGAVLYIIGFAVAWVRRGFRGEKPA